MALPFVTERKAQEISKEITKEIIKEVNIPSGGNSSSGGTVTLNFDDIFNTVSLEPSLKENVEVDFDPENVEIVIVQDDSNSIKYIYRLSEINTQYHWWDFGTLSRELEAVSHLVFTKKNNKVILNYREQTL